jgi:hypothetical protein
MTKWLPDYMDPVLYLIFPGPMAAKTLIEKYEQSQKKKDPPPPKPYPVYNPVTGEKGEGTQQDMGDYLLITYPDGTQEKKYKDDDIGAQIERLLDDHLTWGNIFKLGLVGLGGAIFLGGLKIQREVQK